MELNEIDLSYSGKDGQVRSNCNNIKPNVVGKMNPPACSGPVEADDKGKGGGGGKDGAAGKGGGEQKGKKEL